uniref:Uncharacterized protein n=1 Tax=Astyanax mexicanus TaxID=7994 RepID=W5LRS8_ASTMX
MEKVRRSNEACQRGDFQTAVKLYGEALRADPQNCILYSNRSAAHLKLGQYQTALDDAVKARLLNPKWPKVGGRRRGYVGLVCWVLIFLLHNRFSSNKTTMFILLKHKPINSKIRETEVISSFFPELYI